MDMANLHLHLGKVLGDLMAFPVQALQMPVDILMAGPPCPPWAGQGNRKGPQDLRAHVFFQILIWTFYLIKAGGLLAVCLENVKGILSHVPGVESVMDMFVRVMETVCPEFAWRVDMLHLVHFYRPQSRVRVFLRGIRKVLAPAVPPPLKAFGRCELRDALARSRNTPRSVITGPQRTNLLVDRAEAHHIYIYI